MKRSLHQFASACLWMAGSLLSAGLCNSAQAACADGSATSDELRLRHAEHSYRAELCLLRGPQAGLPTDVQDLGHGLLQLNWFSVTPQGETLAASSVEAVDVEGQLQEIRFDRANYLLHDQRPTFALRVSARDHGAEHDQTLTDLLLYMPQGREIPRVAELNVARNSWGTQCASDCQDSVDSRAVVVVLARQTQGYKDLQLKMRARVTPGGKGTPRAETQVVTWRWNGSRYEATP